jgi:predicted ester cyclase
MAKVLKSSKMMLLLLLVGTVLGGITCTSRKTISDSNIELERKIHEEVWSKGNLPIADKIFSKDIIRHSADAPEMHGLEAYKQYIQGTRILFPDWTETVEEVISSGDLVAARILVRATQSGTLPNSSNVQSTGKKIETHCAVFARIGPEKKITEIWSYYDMTPFVQAMKPNPQSDK